MQLFSSSYYYYNFFFCLRKYLHIINNIGYQQIFNFLGGYLIFYFFIFVICITSACFNRYQSTSNCFQAANVNNFIFSQYKNIT